MAAGTPEGFFDGLGTDLGSLARLSEARTRSISAENPTGEPAGGGRATTGHSADAARDLGPGWKISPAITLEPESTVTLADVEGPGAFQHLWITVNERYWRMLVLRCYWDGEDTPSVEVPLGDFFCSGWGRHAQVSSVPVAVNSRGGFNCYWQMPFRRRARITIENVCPEQVRGFFYQLTYALTEVGADRAYFHAQWRRSNPLPAKQVHTLLDGVGGQGQYIGTYVAWGANSPGWWGEGEVKFFLDGEDYPTICGTGTEDYFGGAWCFEYPKGEYGPYTGPYLGMPQVLEPQGCKDNQQRFGLYRWHVRDPIRFRTGLRVTVQALSWATAWDGRPRRKTLQDDIASTAFWYQTEPHAPFPELPGLDQLEVV